MSFSPRARLRVGWEVRPSVSISQNGDRAEVLEEVQRYFGCGSLRPDRSDRTVKWETRNLREIVERVVPHFERYPLLSGKRHDFARFADICRRMVGGEHLTTLGLQEIVRVAGGMNPSGSRVYPTEAILVSLAASR